MNNFLLKIFWRYQNGHKNGKLQGTWSYQAVSHVTGIIDIST